MKNILLIMGVMLAVGCTKKSSVSESTRDEIRGSCIHGLRTELYKEEICECFVEEIVAILEERGNKELLNPQMVVSKALEYCVGLHR